MSDPYDPYDASVRFQGILQARRIVYHHLRPTPLTHYPLLSRLLGAEAYVKHENHNPTGSFKIRGGLNLVSRLSSEEKQRGIITATRGNHGQSIALAARLLGVRAVVAVPEGNNPEKNEAMEAFGAELLIHGRDFDEAREKVEEIVEKRAMRYVHSANEPLLIEGVGTYALEIVEELPEVDTIFVPVGGGSGICGVLAVVRTIAPQVRVVGVQACNAPAVYRSWREGKLVTTESADTIADGLATRVPFELTFRILSRLVDEIITVTEGQLAQAVYTLFRTTHNVAEAAGAASLAGALQMKEQLAGKKVVLVLSGCNIQTGLFQKILADGLLGLARK